MIERKSGAILNVASTAAFQPGPNMAVYFATKAYVLSLSEALHEELKPHGVQVTRLVPGPTRTEFGEVAGSAQWPVRPRRDGRRAEVVRAGLEGLEKNQAVVVPGVDQQGRRGGTRLRAAAIVARLPDRSNIDVEIEPRGACAVARGSSGARSKNG